MKAVAHAIASLCFLLIGALLGFLGVIEGAYLSGISAFGTCVLLAVAFFHRFEVLASQEHAGRRLFKGNFN